MLKPLISRLKGALNFTRQTFGDPQVLGLEKALKEKCIRILHLKEDLSNANWRLFDLEEDYRQQRDELERAQVSDMVRHLEIQRQAKEIDILKNLLATCRKQKVYEGQKFYNPNDHSAETVYICARWNEWLMIREKSDTIPVVVTHEKFRELYEGYVVMPRMNRNLKNLS